MELKSTLDISPEYLTGDDFTKNYASCEKYRVELIDDQGSPNSYKRKVGMCYLGVEAIKCVTKGSKEDTIFVYSYNGLNKHCENPTEQNFKFSTDTSSGGIFSFFSGWKFWW